MHYFNKKSFKIDKFKIENFLTQNEHNPKYKFDDLKLSANYREELVSNIEYEHLELTDDIYCLAFVKHMYVKNPVLLKELTFKCMITFLCQIIIVSLVIAETDTNSLFASIHKALDSKLNMSRLICSTLLHW